MSGYTVVPIFVITAIIFFIEFNDTRAAILKVLKETDENVNIRSKHMVRYHHTIRGEYPYSLSLQVLKPDNKFHHICGATLLNVQDVMLAITSASCLDDNDPYGNSSFSLVGGVVQSNRTSYQQRRGMCALIVHEDYINNSMDPNPVHPRKHDIALMFINMKKPFQTGFKINVDTIELPSSREQGIEDPLVSIGWEVGDNGYFVSHVFETPALTRKQCVDDYFLQTRTPCLMGLHLSHICAANEEPFEGGRQSRGSPILPTNERYLAAIWSESYSKGSTVCGPHPTPAIFTSIPYHRDWINDQVGYYKEVYKQDVENPKFFCN